MPFANFALTPSGDSKIFSSDMFAMYLSELLDLDEDTKSPAFCKYFFILIPESSHEADQDKLGFSSPI